MKKKKKEELNQLYEYLSNAHLKKEKQYEIQVTDSNGTRKEVINREEYLDFVVCVAVETLGEIFPNIDEWAGETK